MYYVYQTPFSVGINTSRFNNVYAKQENSLWCWAACLEMVLKHKKINVSQSEFAKQTCGVNWQGIPNNCPASFEVITHHLNTFWADSTREYLLEAPLQNGQPDLFRLYDELRSNNPVIVATQNRNSTIGHAVLITGIEGYFFHDSIYVTKIILRDPAQTLENYYTRGRVEKTDVPYFMNSVVAYWFVKLTEYNAYAPVGIDYFA